MTDPGPREGEDDLLGPVPPEDEDDSLSPVPIGGGGFGGAVAEYGYTL